MIGESASHVAVDLAEVSDIIGWLHRESRLLAGERDGAHPAIHFGHASPCGETSAARAALMSALEGCQADVDRYQHHIASLATAIEQVLERYEAVDSDARARNLRQ